MALKASGRVRVLIFSWSWALNVERAGRAAPVESQRFSWLNPRALPTRSP